MLTFLPAIIASVASMHVPDARADLASTLATADSIDWVAANGPTITFGIEHGTVTELVAVKTSARGAVESFQVTLIGDAPRSPGALAWLGDELRDASAISSLRSDDDGAITIGTRDGRRYMVIPGRGSGGPGSAGSAGNAAVEARWAAAWDAP